MEETTKKQSKVMEFKESLRREAKERTIGYILAALGLVAGLAWNEAIKSVIDLFFPRPGNDIIVRFIYAVGVTLFVVVISVYLIMVSPKKPQ